MNDLPATVPLPPTPPVPAVVPPDPTPDLPAAPPGTMNDPHGTLNFAPSTAADAPSWPQVPGFVIEQELGRGGMGVVYRAQQMPLGRTVALKMILAGDHASADAKVRFLAEAEAIARVQHPGIVQVYAFGTHQGHPYCALEYLEGGGLDRLLTQGPLLPAEAAALVAGLAEAVEAAHRQGIIHRDLKPGNILLADKATRRQGDKEQPERSVSLSAKVTDFGLAKQLDAGPGLTASGAVVGTPSYMAPEQAAGETKQIGPATDVYALGAILYECLTGRPPFRGATVFDTLDMVLRQEPVTVRQLQPSVPRDVETVCHKCLHKDPAKRYASAAALADDLRNFLGGKPVQARPISRLERAWKWCRRYPAVAALVVVAILAALVATSLAAWAFSEREQARENEQQAIAARNEKDKALVKEAAARKHDQAIAAWVNDDFLALTTVKGQERFGGEGKHRLNKDLTLRQLLNRAADKLDRRADLDPRTEADLCWMIGESYRDLGAYPQALAFLERCVALRQRALPEHDEATLSAQHSLALVYQESGKLARARQLHEQLRTVCTVKFGPDHAHTLTTLLSLAMLHHETGNLPEALRLFEYVRDIQLKTLGPDHVQTLATLNGLASVHRAAGRLSQAIPLFEQVRAGRVAKLGPDHTDTLDTLDSLAATYRAAGRIPEALRLFEQVHKGRVAKLGADDPETLATLHSLAQTYQTANQPSRAIPLYEQVRKVRIAQLGPTHPETLSTLHNLAVAYSDVGKLAEAIPLLETIHAANLQEHGPGHPHTLTSLNSLASAHRAAGKLPEAIKLYERQRDLSLKHLGADHPLTLGALCNLASAYKAAGRVNEALPLLEQAAHGFAKERFQHELAARILPVTIQAYEDAQQWDHAERWRRQWLAAVQARTGANSAATASEMAGLGLNLLRQQKWDDAAATLRACLVLREKREPDAWTTFHVKSALGAALLGQQKYAEAEPLLLQGYQGMKQREAKMRPKDKSRLAEALERLLQLYNVTGKQDEATKWKKELETLKAPVSPRDEGKH